MYFQYVTEKMGGAEGTKLDMEFTEMERVCPIFLNQKFTNNYLCLTTNLSLFLLFAVKNEEQRKFDHWFAFRKPM